MWIINIWTQNIQHPPERGEGVFKMDAATMPDRQLEPDERLSCENCGSSFFPSQDDENEPTLCWNCADIDRDL